MTAGRLVRLLPDWQTESYPLNALLPSGRFVPMRVPGLVDFLAGKFEVHAAELLRVLSRPSLRPPE